MNKSQIKYCQDIMRKAGRTYYFATMLFPKEIREATYVLYAFYRIPDDIVDKPNKKSKQSPAELLKKWIESWQECFKTGKSYHPVLEATYYIHKKYNIDFSYSEDFLKAMLQDLTKSRYNNYEELTEYMYGSAAVVGIMMTHVIGTIDKKSPPKKSVLEYASKLGYAMQLTNFMRDIGEDINERDRIYMPVEDYKRFEITEEDFIKNEYPARFKEFMEFELQRAEHLYNESFKGIPDLNKYGRLAVKLAARLYMEYHKLIRESDYKVFEANYKVSKLRRIKVLLKSLFN